MARRYYRVATTVWRQEWDDDTRLVALYLLTSPHRTTEGLFRLPLDYARSDLRWTKPARRFDRPFEALIAEDFIAYDAKVSVCLIVNALAYQAPENPNQVKAAIKALRELPDTPLLDRLVALAATHAKAFHQELGKAFPNRCATVTETVAEPILKPVANTPSTSPSTYSTTTPTPPTGGRARDRQIYEGEVSVWAADNFPDVAPDLVATALGSARPRSVEGVSAWLERWASSAPGVAATGAAA